MPVISWGSLILFPALRPDFVQCYSSADWAYWKTMGSETNLRSGCVLCGQAAHYIGQLGLQDPDLTVQIEALFERDRP